MVPILGPIIGPLTNLLMWLTNLLHSYGLAIIVFTILVRGVLAPLNLRQLQSAKKMAALGPRIKELQQKYKGNREELTRAQMALYKEEGVNPAAGCLPLLLQMPILYSLFFVFRDLADKHSPACAHVATAACIYHQKFLWFTLDKPDNLFGHFAFGTPSAAWGPLPIMAAVLQWVQQRMMMQPTNDPQQRTTQQIMQFMPIMIFFFAVNYPSGLALYWVTSTLFSIVMQYFITGWGQLFSNPLRAPEAPAAGAATGSRARVQANAETAGSRPDTSKTVQTGSRPGPPVTAEGDSARLGKMQRAVLRSNTRARPRSSKGAKR